MSSTNLERGIVYAYNVLERAEAGSAGSNATGHGSASSNSTATKPKKIKHIDHVRTTTGYWHWYIVAGIVGLCTLHNIITLLRRYSQRKAGIKRNLNDHSEGNITKKSKNRWQATETLLSNFFFVRSLPVKLYEGVSITEWMFSIAYIGICTGLTLYRTYQNGSRRVELEFGMICYVQIPLIVALASRNNVLSYLTGISYQKLNILHRSAGRACYIFAWVHTIAYLIVGLGKHGPGNRVFLTGVLALIGFTIATVSPFALARRVMYETFLVLHIVFILLFLVGCFLHRPKKDLQPWIIAGFVIWGFDRFVGLCRMAIVNKVWLMPLGKKHDGECSECTVELVTHDVVRLSVPRPLLRWGPGQHALVTMPSVATLRYEQHPFSFANIPSTDGKGPAVFIIRAHDGFTRKLVNHLQEEKTTSIQCYLDGPYGIAESYAHHDCVLLIGGGTGITHILSIFLSILSAHRRGESAVKSLRLVWNIRHLRDINWISPLLNNALSEPLTGLDVNIDIHLTRSHASDEPDMSRGLTELLADHYTPSLQAPTAETPMTEKGYKVPYGKEGEGSHGTPSSSGSSSNASKERLGDEEGDKEKKITFSGELPKVNEEVAKVIKFKAGRAGIEGIMEEEIMKAETTMGISVCGPVALSMDTRRAVENVNTAKRVWNGQAKIELSVEKFGW